MPQDPRRRQKSVERKSIKRKQKQLAVRRQVAPQPTSARATIRLAAHWPLYECLITRDWSREGGLVQIVVARRSPAGEIAAGVFLVDLGCLGVKNAFARLFDTRTEYEALRQHVMDTQPLVSADLNLAAKVIRESIAYARQLGFEPHRDYHDAAVLLAGADPDACDARIPLGKDGKPFYVSGPHDNVERIVAKLNRTVGPGNSLVHVGSPPAFEEEEEDGSPEEEEEE
ncbi:MAG: hypothetical protein HYY04_18375, partial [Chloroflexi bacterium]|nr:hypothetical protein [Chloroflexota bacterium]